MAAVLCKHGSKEALLCRLKWRPWDRVRSLLTKSNEAPAQSRKKSEENGGPETPNNKGGTSKQKKARAPWASCVNRPMYGQSDLSPQGASVSPSILQIPGFRKRLLEAERTWLYTQGEWAGAAAVMTGDWTWQGLGEDSWRKGIWAGARGVLRVQQTGNEREADTYVRRLRDAGLSGQGEGILHSWGETAETESSPLQTRSCDWMFWLEKELRWQRPTFEGNVAS